MGRLSLHRAFEDDAELRRIPRTAGTGVSASRTSGRRNLEFMKLARIYMFFLLFIRNLFIARRRYFNKVTKVISFFFLVAEHIYLQRSSCLCFLRYVRSHRGIPVSYICRVQSYPLNRSPRFIRSTDVPVTRDVSDRKRS